MENTMTSVIRFEGCEVRLVADASGEYGFSFDDICTALELKSGKTGYGSYLNKLEDGDKALVDRGVFDGSRAPDRTVAEEGLERFFNARCVYVDRGVWIVNAAGVNSLADLAETDRGLRFLEWFDDLPEPQEIPIDDEPTGRDLVQLVDHKAVTDTLVLAEGTGNQHKNVLELVRRYKEDLEEFGSLAFKTRPLQTAGGEQKRTIAYLNEHQATLLLTYMKNTEKIRKFKKALVKAFFKAMDYIRKKETSRIKNGGFDGYLADGNIKKSKNMYFPVSKLVESADKYLGGEAALRALNYFTGMPVNDLIEKIKKNKQFDVNPSPGAGADKTVRGFVEDICELDEDGMTSKNILFERYRRYCNEISEPGLSRAVFFKELYALVGGIRTFRPRNDAGRVWQVLGIRVLDT
ncbi:Rha family transcriptional regulator [Desulfobacula phenolica]|uniref:Phage regulatory protein Rha (Phage_pRha) n=1 Tax=Desulfobacula phenolica TaxID=90732 RepID=A0A1H2I330_9BACT|nr:Rha family transcriptional regulator [Desulfobacula phenolica]SDU38552.1 Phage regulatory protein Rha (Phage_pRha) [Desulfobacula phenolica]